MLIHTLQFAKKNRDRGRQWEWQRWGDLFLCVEQL